MGVQEAWEMGYTGKGVVVALVGDGLDTNHYDLVDNFVSHHANIIFKKIIICLR